MFFVLDVPYTLTPLNFNVPCTLHLQIPRDAHPVIKFSCAPCEPMVVENFPFDKYEMEQSPLTHYILARKQPNVAWQVIEALCTVTAVFQFYFLKACQYSRRFHDRMSFLCYSV